MGLNNAAYYIAGGGKLHINGYRDCFLLLVRQVAGSGLNQVRKAECCAKLLKYRYSGEYWDEETGTYYLRARYYAPNTGRFMAEDSAMDGLNWYVYANSNPVTYNDPSGHLANLVAAGVLAAVGFVGGFVGAAIADKMAGREFNAKAAALSGASWAAVGGLAGLTFGASLAATGVIATVTAATGAAIVSAKAAGVAAGFGATLGVVSQVTSDVSTSVMNNSDTLELSNWQTYIGSGAGGALGGIASIYGAGPIAGAGLSAGSATFISGKVLS